MKYFTSEKQFEPHVRVRKWFYRIVFWTLSLLILLALLRNTDWAFTFSQLLNIPSTVLLFCTLGWLCSFLFRAIRFKSEWHQFGNITMASALRLAFLHNAAVVLVPFRVGELGYPVLVRQLVNASWQQCIRSLLWLRFQDSVVLLVLAFLMLPFLSPAVRIAFILSAFFLLLVFKPWWIRLLRTRYFFMRQLRAFLHQRSNAWGWFWSTANWTIKLLVISLMLQNLTGLQSLQTFHGALTGELSALLPLTGPAGFGTYEAGVWTGLGLPWQDIKVFMASIFLTHLFFLIISLMGAGLVICLEFFDWYPMHSPQEHLHG
ncbi:MAG: hypothetical protein EB002_05365 [Betaproteobacteria bacterium]|jgi:uncharacterized membrane protein YbhN (UPF0104 family)|nr:hypothetical protein [Betaproteobacteria bacterium]